MRPAHRVLLLLPALLLAVTSCDSPPPPPQPSQEPQERQPKAASNADDAKADGPGGQDQRSGDDADASRAVEVSYPPEAHERFRKLQQLINAAKELKRTFHANENKQAWEAADEAMAKALNFGYEFPEAEVDYPGLQDTMAGLGQMMSDHGQWSSDD